MDSIAHQTLSSLVQVAAPAATVAPIFQYAPVYPRQDKDEVDTCGYLSLTKGYLDVLCPGSCTTSDSFFGCDQWFFTTCYNSRDAMCTTGSLGLLDKCCTHTDMPNCVTASKNVKNDWLTYYACATDPISGTYVAVDQKSAASKQSSSVITSSTSSTTSSDVDTSTSVRNSEPTGDESNADKSTGKSSETNVGAIVGGVLGGIALIALIGFGIWFIRFQKRKGAKEPEEAHPYVGLTEQSPANQPYPGTEYTADTPKSDFSAVASPATAYQPSYPAQAVEAPAGDHAATMHQPMSAHHPGYQTQLVEAPDDNNKRAELM